MSPPQTGDPSPPQSPSRSTWQTLGSQTSAGLQTAKRTARTATRATAPPTGRTDTTAVRPHILEPQVLTRRVFQSICEVLCACKYGPGEIDRSSAVDKMYLLCQAWALNTTKRHFNGFNWFTFQWGQMDMRLQIFQSGLLELPQNPGFVYFGISSFVRSSEMSDNYCRSMRLASINTPCEHYCVLPSTSCLPAVSLSLFPFAVDDSANLPPSPPPSPSAEQTGPVAPGTLPHTSDHSRH